MSKTLKILSRPKGNAEEYGYMIIKDRGENPVTRYVIFYTADTKRNERYEQKCHEAGLEIKEYINE